MNYQELIDWLFEKTTRKPQIGFATRLKRALCWIPGKDPTRPSTVTWAMEKADLQGCTQLAFDDWFQPMKMQTCEVCWVGLDIDADDNPGKDLIEWVNSQPKSLMCSSMVRTSCSGKGLHVIYRLAQPINTNPQFAGQLVKAVALKYKEMVEAEGIHVCKADRRMFWLMGGSNQVLFRNDTNWVVPTEGGGQVRQPLIHKLQEEAQGMELSENIKRWADALGLNPYRKSTPVYVGELVLKLRSLGEKVDTKSPCSGNGNINGYIDLSRLSISLWSYADGHTIWAYTDVCAMLGD